MTLPSNRFKDIDYRSRPESYWEVADPLQAILTNVQGTQRRQMIRDYWEAGRIEELADAHLLDVLDEETRVRIGQIHPCFMGGEYLQAYEPGQIEIARVELKSTTADVISVRAKKSSSRISYSVVDEYETEFTLTPGYSEKPLTLEELVGLIDGIDDPQMDGAGESSGSSYIERLNQMGPDFVHVDSIFYPQLSVHYKKVTDP